MKNFPDGTTEQELYSVFIQFGEIESLKIMTPNLAEDEDQNLVEDKKDANTFVLNRTLKPNLAEDENQN